VIVASINRKKTSLVAACDRELEATARLNGEIARLERDLQAAKDAAEQANVSVFRLMEQMEALDRLLKDIEALAGLGLDLEAVGEGEPLRPDVAAPPAPDDAAGPATDHVAITTKPVSELVRAHLHARPGRNFTPAEMADAIFNEYPGSWRSPQEIIKAVSCALPRAGRRVPTGRGVAFQAVGRLEASA
jgi:hypothetical protein